MRDTPRLLAVASHPVQYFAPLYRALTARGLVCLRVAYCRDHGLRPGYDAQFGRAVQWDSDLLSGYESAFFWNLSPFKSPFNPLHALNPGVLEEAYRWPDVVWVNGIFYPTNWLAGIGALAAKRPILFRSDLTLTALQRGSTVRRKLRAALYRACLARVSAALTIGAANERAYRHLGLTSDRLFRTPFSVEMDRFARPVAERIGRRLAQRTAWGLGDDCVVVLFLGKLTPRKHPEFMLKLGTLPEARRIALVWIGSGEMEPELRRQAVSDSGSGPRMVLGGFVNQAAIPDVLWAADIFAFPAVDEPWGLVLNEAMAAGLPSVVSTAVGAAEDLVVNRVTGFAYDPESPGEFVNSIAALVQNAELRLRMGMAAREHIMAWTPTHAAAGIEAAVEAVLERQKHTVA